MVGESAAKAALREHFGYEEFRPGQQGVVEAILAGRDALAVMPTGAGKSVCYQVPGIVLPGLALVVSPLVSLMGDQVRALLDAGVRGAYLNSTLTPGQQATVLRRALDGRLPDHVRGAGAPGRPALPRVRAARPPSRSWPWTRRTACRSGARISARRTWPSAISSSSCRTGPSWRRSRPRPPSACARDIVRLLDLRDPYEVVTGFDRPNLYFGVERLEPEAQARAGIARATRWTHRGRPAASCTAPPARTPTRCTPRCCRRAFAPRATMPGMPAAERAESQRGVHRRRRAGHGGHQRVRHGHRQVERALRGPPQHARQHRGVLPGGRARRARRRAVHVHAPVLERRRRVHLPLLHRAGVGQRGAHASRRPTPCAPRAAACWRRWRATATPRAACAGTSSSTSGRSEVPSACRPTERARRCGGF